MKNSTRFLSAILAAMLCAAAFSACASEVKPPVTDVTTNAQFTTDAPLTIAPITDTPAITTDVPAITEAPVVTTDAPVTTEAPVVTADPTQTHYPNEPFLSILKGDRTFYLITWKSEIPLAELHSSIDSFAEVDFDNDGTSELAVRLSNSNVLILKNNNETVFGFMCRYQSMYQINTDGSFFWNTNAGNTYGCSIIEFSNKAYDIIELWRIEHGNNSDVSYFLKGIAVSEAEFQSKQQESESIVWVEWTDN